MAFDPSIVCEVDRFRSVYCYVGLLEVRLLVSFPSCSVFVVCKAPVVLLTSVKRCLLKVSVPAFQSQSLKIVCTVG